MVDGNKLREKAEQANAAKAAAKKERAARDEAQEKFADDACRRTVNHLIPEIEALIEKSASEGKFSVTVNKGFALPSEFKLVNADADTDYDRRNACTDHRKLASTFSSSKTGRGLFLWALEQDGLEVEIRGFKRLDLKTGGQTNWYEVVVLWEAKAG